MLMTQVRHWDFFVLSILVVMHLANFSTTDKMAKLLAGKFGVITVSFKSSLGSNVKLSDLFSFFKGGGSGLGRAICNRLAEHGAKLIVVDKFPKSAEDVCAKLPAPTEGKHVPFVCDVAHMSEVKKLFEFASKQHSTPPNVVVNSAGIIRDAEVLKMTEEQWDEVLNINLRGTFLVTQIFARAAVASNTPQSIINIASIIGKMGAAERVNYAASKSGVIGFSKSTAAALARTSVRVNSLLPGYIISPMTDGIEDKRLVLNECFVLNEFKEVMLFTYSPFITCSFQLLKAACEKIPMGRMGKPEEIADAVLYLASDLSSYVTGTALEVAGGLGM
ncbi:unnamed protein product [Anisakis simplex]|uniref:Estradiol 17-beta-dehydrogenase 8 (inferred by orthology to a human protein) n=1 Tax=Anisakis simplex TaxID=6269 RepID=A0A0M3K5J0_ANISI|nr:unnamed protein product [Anisakis simplex]